MIIIKPKHGRRIYRVGGGSIIDTLKDIVTSPFAQKLALAAVTGAAKGLVDRKREREREPGPEPKKSKFANKVINGKGIVFD